MNSYTNKLAIIILAAGESKRFGSPKQLALYDDKKILDNAVQICQPLDVPIFVVLGANDDLIQKETDLSNTKIINNADWKNGISSSIKKAIDRVKNEFDAVLFLAADQVLVNTSSLKELIELWKDNQEKLVCAHYNEQIGIPAIFPRAYFDDLLKLRGDKGAKKILMNNMDNVVKLDMEYASIDIDIKDDLKKLQ